MTPTFSTVINITLKRMLDRIHKISFLETLEASGEIQFPRAKRRLLQLNGESHNTFNIHSMEDITCTIAEAKSSAIERTKSCAMYISSYDDFYLIDGKLKFIDIAANQDGANQDGENQDGANQDGANQDGANQDGEKEFELDLDAEIYITIDKDVQDDINKITLIKSRTSVSL